MPELATIGTTNAEIDAAIRRARVFERYDQRVVKATYSARADVFLLQMESGATHAIPRKLLQGLSGAEPSALKKIKLLGHGTGLYWPALDVAHYVSGILQGIYGSEKWMKALHDVGVPRTKINKSREKSIPLSAQIKESEIQSCLRGVFEVTVAEAISQLTLQERLVLMLYYYQEMTFREMSQVLGVPESRIRQVYESATKRLRLLLFAPMKGILAGSRAPHRDMAGLKA